MKASACTVEWIGTAFTKRARETTSGSSAARAGFSKAAASADTKTTANSSGGLACPMAEAPASSAAPATATS